MIDATLRPSRSPRRSPDLWDAMTNLPPRGPAATRRPGPAPRWRVRLALTVTSVVTCAGLGLLGTGAAQPSVALSHVKPVAVVAPDDPPGLDDNAAIGQGPPGAWADPPPVPTAMSLTVPSLVGVDDPPSMGPPPPVDPEVARLLALLRTDAKGSPQDPRPGVRALDAVNFALSQVGLPYVWGAVGPESYDCSGLTWRAYEQAGVTLPRVSADQHASGGTPVAIADLLPGDLVFFATVCLGPRRRPPRRDVRRARADGRRPAPRRLRTRRARDRERATSVPCGSWRNAGR